MLLRSKPGAALTAVAVEHLGAQREVRGQRRGAAAQQRGARHDDGGSSRGRSARHRVHAHRGAAGVGCLGLLGVRVRAGGGKWKLLCIPRCGRVQRRM